jgi:drug/metabolite transporter (DMT)-like permease
MQTALLGLSELLVAVFFSYLLLGERFSHSQWVGALLLSLSLLMVIFERPVSNKNRLTGWLSWISSAPAGTAARTHAAHMPESRSFGMLNF